MSETVPNWARGRVRYKKYALGEPWSEWADFQSLNHFAYDLRIVTPYAVTVIPTPDLIKFEVEPY